MKNWRPLSSGGYRWRAALPAALAAALLLPGLPATAGFADAATTVLPSVDGSPSIDAGLLDACDGQSPIVCTWDLPAGDYDVTVQLGSAEAAASTAVFAESRRFLVDTVNTDAGRIVERRFTVNVRTPESQQTGADGDGTPGLTLSFTGSDPAVAGIGIAPADEHDARLVLVGDSTVTDWGTASPTGWGQHLPRYFQQGLAVVNHSGSGVSTSSFLARTDLWQTLRDRLRRNDTVLIQLAHNDKSATAEEYRANLTTLVEGVRAKGATPVLVTPIVRHRFQDGRLTSVGLIVNDLGVDHPAEIRSLAVDLRVPLIDLTARSQHAVEALGPVDSEPIYLIRETGDRTHLSLYGASVYSAIVADELRGLGLLDEQVWGPEPAQPHTGGEYYVAPGGDDAAAGSFARPWASLARAEEAVQPGDTVHLRGGTYAYDQALRACASQTDRVEVVSLSKSGTEQNPIRYVAYPGETPVLDFSGVLSDCRIKGISVTADWIELIGLEVTGVRQNNSLNNESWGIWIAGSHNLFDRIDTHHHMGPGLFIQNGGGNLVRNSDSHDNYDPYSKAGDGQNADGFGAHSPAGNDENIFDGNRAWANSDDGFDLISANSPVTITRSWAWLSGYIPGTRDPAPSGNGVGFKVGGYGGRYEAESAKHTVSFSVAFDNRSTGFYANHHPIANDFFNNTAFSNRVDFNLLGVAEDGSAIGTGVLRNNVAYGGGGIRNLEGADSSFNSWDLGLSLREGDFLEVSTEGWDAPRNADGSLPELPFLRPAAGSTLIDRGVDIGASYLGTAPDLGAFEFSNAPEPGAVRTVVAVRCPAGRAQLVVTVSNLSPTTLIVSIETDFGDARPREVAAGQGFSQSFATRLVELPEGSLRVSASAESDGRSAEEARVVRYQEKHC